MVDGPEDGGYEEALEYNLVPQTRSREPKPDFSDRIKEHKSQGIIDEHEDAATDIAQDFWKAYDIGRQLESHYEETGDFWVLQVVEGALEPVLYVSDEFSILESDFDSEDGQMSEGSYDYHPTTLLEHTEDQELMKNLVGYQRDSIDAMPNLDFNFESLDPTERIEGALIAPGALEGYRQRAEEEIERYFTS